ncbi:MAG: hypothetical protein ACYC5J_18150 [Chloroflexota bacterium]
MENVQGAPFSCGFAPGSWGPEVAEPALEEYAGAVAGEARSDLLVRYYQVGLPGRLR